jgi:uncharacterized protein (TIGR00251 family)
MIEASPAGTLLHVNVKPKASRNGIVGVHADRLKIAVSAAPEKGKANAAVLEVIAKQLCLKRSQLSLVAGETNTIKTLLVSGISAEGLRRQIEAVLHSPEPSA